MQVIYIDILFMMNLVMDLFIFRMTGLLINNNISRVKLLIGSNIAALFYCMTICIPILQQIPSWLFVFVIPIPSLLYMFKPKQVKNFITMYGISLVIAWIVGGVGFNMYYIAVPYMGQKVAIIIPVLAALIILFICQQSLTWLKKKKIHLEYEYDLELTYKGNTIKLKSFLDTGNHLYNLNHQPVILVNKEALWKLFEEEEQSFLQKCMNQGIESILLKKEEQKMKIHLIPFQSVGCRGDILIGFSADRVVLKRGINQSIVKNCIIGIAPNQLFKDEGYQGLIHPECITSKEGEIKNEIRVVY